MANEYKGVSSIVALVFGLDQSGAMTKATHVVVPISGWADVDGDAYTFPFDGAIVGISQNTESIATADNLMKAYPTIEGAEIAGYCIQVADAYDAYARFEPDDYPVAAGEVIGAEIVSDDSTGTPTPNHTVVVVYVQIGRSRT